MIPVTGRPRRSSRALPGCLGADACCPFRRDCCSARHLRPAPLVSSAISGAVILPLISGDTRNGVTFEGVPDGLGYRPQPVTESNT